MEHWVRNNIAWQPPPAVPAGADDFVADGAAPAAASPAAPTEQNRGGCPPKPKPEAGIVQTTIRLPKDLHRAIKKASIDRETNLAYFLVDLARRELGV